MTKEVSGSTVSYHQRLHALDITTGAEKLGGPVDIRAAVPGTGDASVKGVVNFDPKQHLQRPALLLDHGFVYISWASHFDHRPYHGWVMAYDARTLQQAAVFNDTPNGNEGGIWFGGGGPSADAAGNVYVATGNGTFDTTGARADWGDSFLKLSSGSLAVSDFFTPHDEATLESKDLDLGSSGLLLLPDQVGAHPHEMIGGGKAGVLYLVDRDNLGQFDPNTDHVVQTIDLSMRGVYDTPAYFNNTVYVHASGDAMRAYHLADGTLSVAAVGKVFIGFPGATPVISANGNSNGIVWETDRTSAPTVLRAFDAISLKEIYNTTQNSARDGIGTGLKFSAPTVADGHVLVGAVNALNVFGLVKPTVAARHVFYRHTAFDKNGNDAAIATDKQALRPGQTATFANYTSFSKGINGIMVDVRQLPGTPSLADFDFRVGNDNNPAAWAAAPSPQITLRRGAGDGQSDRIELVWPDGAIRNEWLQVTVKADAATGLASPDVFYFGNAIGESGNSAADAIVDMNDELAARGDPHNFRKPAEVTNAHDYNRDGRVDATDQLLARHNATNATTALRLIAPPPQATAAAVQSLLRRRTARKHRLG